jgi:hypothetical protein
LIEEDSCGSTGLKTIIIPWSVTVISKCSFRRCESLTSILFESGAILCQIEDFAFGDCGSHDISIPGSA